MKAQQSHKRTTKVHYENYITGIRNLIILNNFVTLYSNQMKRNKDRELKGTHCLLTLLSSHTSKSTFSTESALMAKEKSLFHPIGKIILVAVLYLPNKTSTGE